ncbi:MAG: SGNH/GDSL hydrolase family protein [Bryobacteraceae bacterium]
MRSVVLPIAVLATALTSRPEHALSWIGSWACSQQIPEPGNALPADELRNATLRQIIHLSAGGSAIRIHLSNAFGLAPLHLASVHVAQPFSNASGKIDTATDKVVSFAGRDDVIIPPGAEFISDPLQYAASPGTDLTISIHYDNAPQPETGHPGSRATSYLSQGDLVSSADLPRAKQVDHWFQISAVDVLRRDDGFSLVTLGDSITDGHGSTTNGNDRWPDVLARRLQHEGLPGVGVLNQGIGGNHLLTDGLGPNALARFDRDVLAQTGVRYVIVLEGVNDLGGLARTEEASPAKHAELVRRIIGAYEQIVARAHAHNLRVIGGAILPYAGSDYYHPDSASEADRQAVNAWIRNSGSFDAVIDFDRVARDPAHLERLLPAFDSGDHLHPSPAGYAAMANAVPLSMFRGP